VDAFVKQYKYNMGIAPNKTSLSNLENRDKESIREYAQRWRDLAAQVHPRDGHFICQHTQDVVL
jgi:predicted transcriptional regulator of viral defense system